jgi:hypothetical protein
MTLDKRSILHAISMNPYAYLDYQDEFAKFRADKASFKAGWKECFHWVLSEVEKHYGESTLIHTKEFMLKLKEKHKSEIGE